MTGVDAKIGIGAETTWGTGVVSQRHFVARDGITDERGRLRDAMTFGTRSTLPADPGRVRITGSLNDIPGRPETLGALLRAALGAPVTTGGPGPYTHTYTPKTAKHSSVAALPPYSINIKRRSDLIDRITGAQLNQLELRQPADDVLLCNTDWIGKGIAAGTDETLALDVGTRFRYKHLAVTKSNVAFPYLTDLTLTINNNLDPEEVLDGSDEIASVDFGDKLLITAAMTLTFRDKSLVDEYRAGTSDDWGFVWTLDGNTSLDIAIPRLSIDSASAPIDGPGRVTLSVTGTAEYDAVAGHEIEIALKNSVATY